MSSINNITVYHADLVCESANHLDTTLTPIDGISITTGMVVLFPNLTNAAANGLYTATVSGNTVTWARSSSFNSGAVFQAGMYVGIYNGIVYSDNLYYLPPSVSFTLDVTPIYFLKTTVSATLATTVGSISSVGGGGGGGGGVVTIDQSSPGISNGVVVNSSALPTGAATAALQQSILTSLTTALIKVVPQVRTTAVDYSGTITVGGTAQQIIPANANRLGFIVQNTTNTDVLYIEIGAPATTDSAQLFPGQIFSTDSSGIILGYISVVGPTTGQSYWAKELI